MASTRHKLKSFGIRNFRSFSERGVHLDKINKINLFIGKNNSGKSNFLKFINEVSLLKNNSNFPSNIESQYRRNQLDASIIFKIPLDDLNFPESYRVNFSTNSWHKEFFFRDQITGGFELEYHFNRKIGSKVDLDARALKWPKEAFHVLSNHYKYPQYTLEGHEETRKYFSEFILNNLLIFFENVIYIPDLRFIKEGVSIAHTNTQINGANIISEIFQMQNPKIGEEGKKQQLFKIQKTVKDLLDIDDLHIEIPHSKDQMIINLNGTRLPLEYFGTGIHELVILCSALIIHNEHIICLEEPEIHLHPELQKKFFNFLHSTNNIYFISTHSNAFLDVANENVSIYHVQNENEETKISLCKSNKESFEILNDLGYKASDLLQANCIIWVEGPSDRTFLKKWISLKEPNLVEGIHYSIMFYGGKLLSHFSADLEYLEHELIPLFRFNRNAFVIIDSDISLSKTKINETKKRINAEIGEKHCWITKGKEIENYLSPSVVKRWLKDKVNRDVDFKLAENETFPDVIEKQFDFKYSALKNLYSKEIVEYMTIDDLDVLDLKGKITQLTNCISQWNGIKN